MNDQWWKGIEIACEKCGTIFALPSGSLVALQPHFKMNAEVIPAGHPEDRDYWILGCDGCSNASNYWVAFGEPHDFLTAAPLAALQLTNHVSRKVWFDSLSFFRCLERLNARLPTAAKLNLRALHSVVGRPEAPLYDHQAATRWLNRWRETEAAAEKKPEGDA